MANAPLYEFLNTAQDYYDASKKLLLYPEIRYRGGTDEEAGVDQYKFLTQHELEEKYHVRIRDNDYGRITAQVRSILRFTPLPVAFLKYVQKFLSNESAVQTGFNSKPLLDDNGIAKSYGRRKRTVAKCQMVEGTGEIRINGQSLIEYFPWKPKYRENVIQPLVATETLGKYNIWLVTKENAGPSGVSEACRLAIAYTLALHRPELLGVLNQLKMLTHDHRVKERKKPGLLKARKASQWVKR